MVRLDPKHARVIETCETSVLGALRFADATTGAWITSPLRVTSPRATLVRNRSGVFVITRAAGFDPDSGLPVVGGPPQPALEIDVEDAAGRYLPRRVHVSLPRDSDPEHREVPDWLFRAQRVPLYLAPAAVVYPGQAAIRVTATDAATSVGIPHVWLRLTWTRPLEPEPGAGEPGEPGDADGVPEEPAGAGADAGVVELLGAGMTDARGEALVAVSGVPVTNWAAADNGPVLATEIDAVLDAYVDASADSPPDPDIIDLNRELLPTARADLKLAAAKETIVRLALTLSVPD